MNPEKIAQMKSQVRIGGKGTVRRKKKNLHKNSTSRPKSMIQDGKIEKGINKLIQNNYVKLLPEVEEIDIIKRDGSKLHFDNPTVFGAFNNSTHIFGCFAGYQPISKQIYKVGIGIGGNGTKIGGKLSPDAYKLPKITKDKEDLPKLMEEILALASENKIGPNGILEKSPPVLAGISEKNLAFSCILQKNPAMFDTLKMNDYLSGIFENHVDLSGILKNTRALIAAHEKKSALPSITENKDTLFCLETIAAQNNVENMNTLDIKKCMASIVKLH